MTTLEFITNTIFFFSGVCLGIIVMCLNKMKNKIKAYLNECLRYYLILYIL